MVARNHLVHYPAKQLQPPHQQLGWVQRLHLWGNSKGRSFNPAQAARIIARPEY